MNFELSEQQIEVRDLARKILEDYSSNEQLRALDKSERFDEKLWHELAAAGLLGVAIDEAHGGMGFDVETLALLIEESGRTVAAVPLVPALVLAALPVQRHGSKSLQQAILPGLVSGEKFVTAALGEIVSYDVQPVAMVAERDGDNWLLSGEKHFVPFADRADHVVVAANTPAGPGLFVIERDANGVTLQPQTSTAGESQSKLICQNVAVNADYCISDGEDGGQLLRQLENIGMAAVCTQMTGVCEVMMRLTASYTSEREQFGVKVATFQAVGQRAADCYIDVECLRLVTQRAIYAAEHCSEEEAREACMVAKIWAGDAGHRVSHAAQHLHGGMGVDRDYSLWRYCLWAKQLEHTLGNSAELTEQLGESIALSFKSA